MNKNINYLIKYMKRYILLVLLATLAAPAWATEYILTTVRIETADDTIYSGDVYIPDSGCTVTDHEGNDHDIDGAAAICALNEAATLGGFDYVLQDSSFGLYLTEVDEQAATDTDYWSFFVNYTAASVGLAEYTLENGDEMILSLGGYPNSALELQVPAKEILSGNKFVVRVKVDGKPMAGATVHFNNQKKITDSLGKASFKPKQTTSLDVYVTATGYTRSATTTLRVVEKNTANKNLSTEQEQTMIVTAAEYLAGEVGDDGLLNSSQSVTDWAAISLAAAGQDTSALTDAIVTYNPKISDDYAAGEIARHILALEALGLDAQDSNGINYVTRLLKVEDDTAFVNDNIFVGLALLAAGVPTDDADVQQAITTAKAGINADGGVSYAVAETISDVDTTAYFIQLLTAAGKNGQAKQQAIRYLKDQQNLDGGWGYSDHGVSNSSSTAVALQALPNLVRQNHWSGYNFLNNLQKPNGRFVYDTDGSFSYETLNSAYAIMALAHQALPVVY
ncbi:MAG: prenyltransferase/squalene oxidase [uncultured bacterium]|nr:MAG: prenyltransferase/squalene oxidase [uncultured bacterium]